MSLCLPMSFAYASIKGAAQVEAAEAAHSFGRADVCRNVESGTTQKQHPSK